MTRHVRNARTTTWVPGPHQRGLYWMIVVNVISFIVHIGLLDIRVMLCDVDIKPIFWKTLETNMCDIGSDRLHAFKAHHQQIKVEPIYCESVKIKHVRGWQWWCSLRSVVRIGSCGKASCSPACGGIGAGSRKLVRSLTMGGCCKKLARSPVAPSSAVGGTPSCVAHFFTWLRH
jgi:hypothetical protein